MVRTILTACRPVCIPTGSIAAAHGSGRELFDQRAGSGVVIIGLSLMGSFGQNARWVRLAKTPAGASLDRQSRAVRGCGKCGKCGKAHCRRGVDRAEGLSALSALSAASRRHVAVT